MMTNQSEGVSFYLGNPSFILQSEMNRTFGGERDGEEAWRKKVHRAPYPFYGYADDLRNWADSQNMAREDFEFYDPADDNEVSYKVLSDNQKKRRRERLKREAIEAKEEIKKIEEQEKFLVENNAYFFLDHIGASPSMYNDNDEDGRVEWMIDVAKSFLSDGYTGVFSRLDKAMSANSYPQFMFVLNFVKRLRTHKTFRFQFREVSWVVNEGPDETAINIILSRAVRFWEFWDLGLAIWGKKEFGGMVNQWAEENKDRPKLKKYSEKSEKSSTPVTRATTITEEEADNELVEVDLSPSDEKKLAKEIMGREGASFCWAKDGFMYIPTPVENAKELEVLKKHVVSKRNMLFVEYEGAVQVLKRDRETGEISLETVDVIVDESPSVAETDPLKAVMEEKLAKKSVPEIYTAQTLLILISDDADYVVNCVYAPVFTGKDPYEVFDYLKLEDGKKLAVKLNGDISIYKVVEGALGRMGSGRTLTAEEFKGLSR